MEDKDRPLWDHRGGREEELINIRQKAVYKLDNLALFMVDPLLKIFITRHQSKDDRKRKETSISEGYERGRTKGHDSFDIMEMKSFSELVTTKAI